MGQLIGIGRKGIKEANRRSSIAQEDVVMARRNINEDFRESKA